MAPVGAPSRQGGYTMRWITTLLILSANDGKIQPMAKPDVPALIRALKGNDIAIRKQAAGKLRDLGPKAREAVPALVDCLVEPEMRLYACGALRGIGAAAREALPALTALFKKEGLDLLAR